MSKKAAKAKSSPPSEQVAAEATTSDLRRRPTAAEISAVVRASKTLRALIVARSSADLLESAWNALWEASLAVPYFSFQTPDLLPTREGLANALSVNGAPKGQRLGGRKGQRPK